MLKSCPGKLLVYASNFSSQERRLHSVSTATEKTAKLLNLDFEIVKFRQKFSQIYVYYENGDAEPVPIYCDKGKTYNTQEICSTLKNMIFVLSFHPNHTALKHMREEIMRLS